MQDRQVVIDVRNVTKTYKLYNKPSDRLKEAINPFGKKYHKDFDAVKDVSFQVHKGETVGIIGKNGSGKSTLLKMITGVLTPTSGAINVNGRISSLLELGAGFNPEYTGIDNIYLNGSIMGYSKEQMDGRIPEILSFADIGDFVYQPVKMYSSGMFARLAFSVAINVDPDVLIVDEALAVGDNSFQTKCYRKFEALRVEGVTILFVTHSLDLITRHCNRAVLMLNGSVIDQGEPKQVINHYTKIMTIDNYSSLNYEVNEANNSLSTNKDNKNGFFSSSSVEMFYSKKSYNKDEYRWGDGRVKIIDYLLVSDDKEDPTVIKSNSNIELYVKYYFNQSLENMICGTGLKTLDGVVIFTFNTRMINVDLPQKQSGDILIVKYNIPAPLNRGTYSLSVGCSENVYHYEKDAIAVDRRNDAIIFEVVSDIISEGIINPNITFEVFNDKRK